MEFEKEVISIIEQNIEDKTKISLETDIRNGLDIDSFDIIMIIAALEDKFSISIKESEFENVKTVSDIVRMLKERYPEIGKE